VAAIVEPACSREPRDILERVIECVALRPQMQFTHARRVDEESARRQREELTRRALVLRAADSAAGRQGDDRSILRTLKSPSSPHTISKKSTFAPIVCSCDVLPGDVLTIALRRGNTSYRIAVPDSAGSNSKSSPTAGKS
jgi:hypothetical protein